MTPTERGRRFDSLYNGGLTTNDLCNMIVWREQKREDLQALLGDMYEYIRVCGYAGRTINEQRAVADGFKSRMSELGVKD